MGAAVVVNPVVARSRGEVDVGVAPRHAFVDRAVGVGKRDVIRPDQPIPAVADPD